MPQTILVLHGSRQTGDLLLGRMDKLRKRLEKLDYQLLAPTGPSPHQEAPEMRQWWAWRGLGSNIYDGFLEETLPQLQQLWNEAESPVGLIGFSQGARLAHLLTTLHHRQPSQYFAGLQFVILVAGYDAPCPEDMQDMCPSNNQLLSTPSLHVWGETDKLITPQQSQEVTTHYHNPQIHVHEGGHHVPMRAADVRAYVDFIQQACHDATIEIGMNNTQCSCQTTLPQPPEPPPAIEPDEETKQVQCDEVEAMMAIFPDEFQLQSKQSPSGDYEFPISYHIALDKTDQGVWPPKPIKLYVTYPMTYPQTSGPTLQLAHSNNVFEFSTLQREACNAAMQEAVEEGMPTVYACYTAAKDFFESGAMADIAATSALAAAAVDSQDDIDTESETNQPTIQLVKPCSKERIEKCNQQGLDIAASLLKELGTVKLPDNVVAEDNKNNMAKLKGGHWMYTIGLVGKPSAGKSTFFNAATAFARQRDDADNLLGGATMAPHPFTTIDPNVGFCLVPAPQGLCPEDDYQGTLRIGSTHGRDHKDRRLLPVLLKDVAGLVPGAYKGRGRGNKFLNDLTDADVLVHVLDASGTADVEGNDLGVEHDGKPNTAASNPLSDMEWIRKELIEWVYANLIYKWQSVSRKGQSKLMGMFSGYGQSQGLLWSILHAVEKFMEKHEHRDHALDHIDEWDEGDIRRVVSAFLGVRFPMALALNKSDLPTSQAHIADIQKALPIHGAYSGIPLCARQEMMFIRERLERALAGEASVLPIQPNEKIPEGVWSCLTSAVSLHEPVLVFPVTNFTDYAPLPGLSKYATGDPSLPSFGMVSCLESAGGQAPSLWDHETKQYVLNKRNQSAPLRDVLVMKPGSTVDDAFVALKNRRALEGEFVRAEAAGTLGAPSRPVPKHQPLDASNRILRIMTTKKTAWQHNFR